MKRFMVYHECGRSNHAGLDELIATTTAESVGEAAKKLGCEVAYTDGLNGLERAVVSPPPEWGCDGDGENIYLQEFPEANNPEDLHRALRAIGHARR